MKDLESIKKDIITRLEPLELDQVILFGSYAYGTPTHESDLDLYVVTKDEFTPQSFREKSTLTKKVSKAIRDLRSQIAIDLIVHTQSMHKNFKELNSSFSKELFEKGIALL